MKTLDSPVYEVKQESDWYKKTAARREKRRNFFKEINEKYFKDNGFAYYHSEYFGVSGDSEDYEVYKDELKKNPTKDNIYIFKKRSKYYPIFKEMIEEIDDNYSPFEGHDRLGTNNMTGSQWIGDRWFWGVKNESNVKSDEVKPIDYKEYLQVIMETVDSDSK